jgi:hypothetical protein
VTEELPHFVYLHCGLCDNWLAMFGLPTRVTPKLIAAAPNAGWTEQPDGAWHCDKHTQEQP